MSARDALVVGYARLSRSFLTAGRAADADGPDGVARRLLAGLERGGWEVHVDAARTDATVLLDEHESLGASRVPEVLLRARVREASAPDRDELVVVVGNTGAVGVAGRTGVLSDDEPTVALREHEARLAPVVGRLVATLEDALGPVAAGDGVGLLPAGRLLWWHRVVAVGRLEDVPAESLVTGRRVALTDAVELVVGDGYTYVVGPRADERAVAQVIRGIFLATEDWLYLDGLNRRLSAYLASLPAARADARSQELAALAEEGVAFTIEIDLVELYLEERNRYLALGRRAVWLAARGQWGLEGEVARLRDRAQTARELAVRLDDAVVAHVDRARNLLLFVLAFTTVADLTLTVFDFSTESAPAILSAVRGLTAVAVIVATVALAVSSVWASRRRAARRPRRATA